MNKRRCTGLAVLLFCFCVPCFAASLIDPLFPVTQPPAISSRAAVLIDAETGTILFSQNPSMVITPASLTKLMTIHLALNAIKARKASPDDIVQLPPESWAENQPPRSSLMFLAKNHVVTLGELLLGMAVSSGNDAAIATALHLSHSLEAFTAMMNAEAGRLGLASTRFVEPAGVSPENTTSAMDYARFCRVYIREHPDSLALLHSVQSFSYPMPVNANNEPFRTIVQNNRNTLLNVIPGVDGLKTGYIPEAGYNVALSAHRGEYRIIAVLLGAGTEKERDKDSEALLEWGFDNFKILRPAAGFIPTVRIWGGKEKYGSLKVAGDLVFTVSARRASVVQVSAELFPALKAPLSAGEQGGILIIGDELGELFRLPLVLEKEAARGNFFRVFFDTVTLFFQNLFGKT